MRSHAIRTARVPARLSRRHGVRPALEQWLAGADPARHGLPMQAIVLVRRMAAAWTSLADPEPTARYAPLAALMARAVRPAHGELSGDAVWFADEAELLACLACDALAGDLALRWWWKLLLRDLSPAGAQARWLQSPRYVPAALAVQPLAQARAWMRTWAPPARAELVRVLVAHFPVAPEVAAAVVAEAPHVHVSPAVGRAPAPWRIEANAALADAAERVLHLALALSRDPLAASQAAVAPAVIPLPTGAAGIPEEEPARVDGDIAAVVPLPAPSSPADADEHTAGDSPVVVDPPSTAPSAAVLQVQQPPPKIRPLADPVPRVAEPAAMPPAAMARALAPQQPSTFPAQLFTAHGGLLFLLNAAIAMGLYGDFTQPRRPGSLDLSPWRFLLAAGRIEAGRAFAADPLAAWLRARTPPRAAPRRVRRPGLWPQVRERLLLALDLRDARQLAPVLLRLPARLEDQGERVDLHLELADLPLAVRFAGLDRDPGWIPAAGCDIRFHFH